VVIGGAVKLNEIGEIIESLIPVRMEAIVGSVSGGAGVIATILFGEWSNVLQALAMFMLIDYITGVMAAYMKPRAKLSSKKGLKGIVKKLALITFVVFAHYLDLALGQTVFMVLVVYALLGNEGLSIVENLSYCGVPIPDTIKNKLEQLAHEKEVERK
jgi:toxin secretion/phage lysis holin